MSPDATPAGAPFRPALGYTMSPEEIAELTGAYPEPTFAELLTAQFSGNGTFERAF